MTTGGGSEVFETPARSWDCLKRKRKASHRGVFTRGGSAKRSAANRDRANRDALNALEPADHLTRGVASRQGFPTAARSAAAGFLKNSCTHML